MKINAIRFVETFVAVLAVGFIADISAHGAVNLTTPEGQTAVITALGSAFLLALRRALATRTNTT